MAKLYGLTWDKRSTRWKKKYRGRQFYFPFGESKGDTAGYHKALGAWQDLKTKLDNHDAQEEEKWRVEIPSMTPTLEQMRRIIARHDGAAPRAKQGKTIGQCLQLFGDTFKAKRAAGQLAKSNVDVMLIHLATIGKMIGKDQPVTSINGQTFLEFHSALMADVGAKKKSARYAQTLVSCLKRFVRWLAATDAIEKLPSILLMKSGDLGFKVVRKAIKTFDMAEVQALLGAATERTQLYILLALNCGMTQIDISELRPSEVDFKRGTITRKRSKEKDEANVPTVCYKLWPSTLRLLTQFRSENGDRVVLNEQGGPLRSWDKANGDTTDVDSVRTSFNRVCRKLKIKEKREDRRTFKTFRKTASSQLATHREFGRFTQFFLGHAPSNMADSAYVVPPQNLFDEAVAWLGKEFGQVATTEAPKPKAKPKKKAKAVA